MIPFMQIAKTIIVIVPIPVYTHTRHLIHNTHYHLLFFKDTYAVMPTSSFIDTAGSGDEPRRVPLSAEERKNGAYSATSLQMALEGLHQDGMAVLRDLVDPEHCDKLYEHMTGDRDRIIETRHKGEATYNQGVKCESCRHCLALFLAS